MIRSHSSRLMPMGFSRNTCVPASRKAERSGAICVTAVKCCKALTKKGASAAKCDKLAFSVEPACKKALAGFKKQVKAKRRKQVLECE